MNNISPHLPPPTCSVPLHERFRSLKAFVSVVVIALLAGFAAAAALLAWVWPRFVNEGLLFVPSRQTTGTPVLADVVARDLNDRTATVYVRQEALAEDVTALTEKDILGEAVIVSSDGWLAMPLKNDTYTNPTAVLLGQKVVRVEKVVADKEAKILYSKVAAPDMAGNQSGQFKIISFADQLRVGEDVFVHERGNWIPTTVVNREQRFSGSAHIDSLPVQRLGLARDAQPGSLIVTPSGKLAGYVRDNGSIGSVEAITRVVGEVLVSGVVQYRSLGVDGWFSAEVPLTVDAQVRDGFLVTRIRDKATKLKRGDVVLEIQGVAATPDAWWVAIANANQVTLKVLRQGKELVFSSPVVVK